MSKSLKVNKLVEVKKSELPDSFHSVNNDHVRIQANRLSRKFWQWFLVSFDGVEWETYAHVPDTFVMCVQYTDGKFDKVYKQTGV